MGRDKTDWTLIIAIISLGFTFLVVTVGIMNWSYATFVPVRERDKIKEGYDQRMNGFDQKLDRIDSKLDDLRRDLKK